MLPIDLGLADILYQRYREPLAKVRDEQRRFLRNKRSTMTPQLDDLEAEVTYLLLREYQPGTVVELGTFHGWSTTWLLSAIRDSGTGHLYSFDKVDNALSNVPDELAAHRWTFCKGDIRKNLDAAPQRIDYLFVDAAHNARFARWYIENLFPRVPSDGLVSVHDVFHSKYTLPFTEGAVVLKWLAARNIDLFTPSAARAENVRDALLCIKRKLKLDEPVHTGRDNPMIFFHLPE